MTLDTTIAEQVQEEALASSYRRETARQTGATVRGVPWRTSPFAHVGDRIREIAAQLEAEELAERHSAIKTPSDLIAQMRANWPEQRARVEAFAKAAGLPLGEAWARTIAAGVASLNKGRR
jgi:hypothetical protein